MLTFKILKRNESCPQIMISNNNKNLHLFSFQISIKLKWNKINNLISQSY